MEEYKGIPYIVHITEKLGHYCGYIRIPENHPWYKLGVKKRWYKITPTSKRRYHYDYDAIPLEVHGGLTFGRLISKCDYPQGFTRGLWVGWDYAHLGDYVKTSMFPDESGYEWSEEEVERECKNAINQLLKGAL